jgi:transposase
MADSQSRDRLASALCAVRWRRAGVWERLMDAITAVHDDGIQMIDSTSARAHQQAATARRGPDNCPTGATRLATES